MKDTGKQKRRGGQPGADARQKSMAVPGGDESPDTAPLYHKTVKAVNPAVAEAVQGFEILLGHLGRDWPDEADVQAQIVQNDLVRLSPDEQKVTRAHFNVRLLASDLKQEQMSAVCQLFGLPEPARPADTDAPHPVAELIQRIETLDGQERKEAVSALLDLLTLVSPTECEQWRSVIVTERRLIRAAFFDGELARRRNGAGPDDRETGPGDEAQKPKRGRPHKYKLLTADYIGLYEKWDYNVRLNLCQNDVEVNGIYLDDIQLDHVLSRVRDYGTSTKTSVNVQHAKEALSVLATRHAYHPIKDYLESLTWDGKENILALSNYLTAVDQDAQSHAMQWLYHWCVAAIAKIYEGFQSPMLVLDAPQDAGKDYFARWLCPLPEYFIESPIVPDSKDHRLRLIQTFVWDVAELGSTTRRADVEALKAFITLDRVRERKPYGKREIIKPALASFIGTINNDAGFLVDRTGNRRFLVCALKAFDWSYTQHIDVNQVWAQAMHVYKSGDNSWKLDAVAKKTRDKINADYMVDDPVEAQLEALYEFTGKPTDEITLTEIMEDLGYVGIKPSKAVNMAISGVLHSWGAKKDRRQEEGKRERLYKGIIRRELKSAQPAQPAQPLL